ncbi:MAG: hypothetical protein KKF77_13795 [Proteobacteria bacterium]|nr:hypothetical protein [Pseudomonadota bacterium]
MSDHSPSDVMTLAGLALANGPWLAVRLRRLAEHSELPLAEDTVESAVSGSSRVLAQVLDAEGRPSAIADHNTDPAALLGREQATQHRQAGLTMPTSLKSLRLLRRAFDDLVRESWVEKDSRARAHEDVERFFERVLIGHFLAWAENPAAPSAGAAPASAAEAARLNALVAQREDELRRAMDAARQATASLRQSRERATSLAAELAQAQTWGKTQLGAQEALKAELAAAKEKAARLTAGAGAEAGELAALKTKFDAAQERLDTLGAKAKTLEARSAELEARLAEAQSSLAAQREVEDAREMALKEIDNARAEADAAREELRKAKAQADQAVAKAESQTLLARRETEEAQAQTEAAREELRRAHEAHATLASEAEAMRTRLAETGSRMDAARRTEEAETQARLTQAQERLKTLEAEAKEAVKNIETLSARLAEQESLHAFKDERMREQSRAVLETQELLVKLGATKNEIVARAQAADAERERLSAELDGLNQSTKAEREALAAELEALRQTLTTAEKQRDANRDSAKTLEAERDALAARLIETGNSLDEATRNGKAAATARDACTSLLSTHLALTEDAVAAVDATGAIAAWNQRFPELFGLAEADRASSLDTLLPRLAKHLQRPEAWLARVRELLADTASTEEGLTLASTTGQTLVFRSHPTASVAGAEADGRLFNFRDVSLEHDMENLVREIEAITRYELGHSLTAFIHLPQELLDDPATTPEQTQKLTVIRDSGYRIVNTVNMAVDIFRMERGLYTMPSHRNLDLAVVARRAVKDVSTLAASRHIDLELLLENSPLPQSTTLPGPGDPIPAHALTVNLLRDALEAAPRQSGVQASLHTDDKAKLLCLDITRPGTLTPDEQARFFDKPVGKDPGDGLARARYAAKLIAGTFHGSLTVSSSNDTTTMSLRLPKA